MPESNGDSDSRSNKSVVSIGAALDQSLARALSQSRGTPPPHGLQVRGTQVQAKTQSPFKTVFLFKGPNAEFIARFVHDICWHTMGSRDKDESLEVSNRGLFEDGPPTDRYFFAEGHLSAVNDRLETVAQLLENDRQTRQLLDYKLALYKRIEDALDCKLNLAFETGLNPMELRIKKIYFGANDLLARELSRRNIPQRAGFEAVDLENGEWHTSDRIKKLNGRCFNVQTIEAGVILEDLLQKFVDQTPSALRKSQPAVELALLPGAEGPSGNG